MPTTRAERSHRSILIDVRARREAVARQLAVLKLAEEYHEEQVRVLERAYLSGAGDGI